MPQFAINKATYPGFPPTVVERLLPRRFNTELAIGMKGLKRVAYTEQMGAAWVADNQQLKAQHEHTAAGKLLERIHRGFSMGIRSWITENSAAQTPEDRLSGFIELVPFDDFLLLSDFVVRPPFGRGEGSKLFHTALTADVWDPDLPIRLQAFRGSSSNEMYEKLGFVQMGEPYDRSESVHYETPPGAGVRSVVDALQERRPELAFARMD